MMTINPYDLFGMTAVYLAYRLLDSLIGSL